MTGSSSVDGNCDCAGDGSGIGATTGDVVEVWGITGGGSGSRGAVCIVSISTGADAGTWLLPGLDVSCAVGFAVLAACEVGSEDAIVGCGGRTGAVRDCGER